MALTTEVTKKFNNGYVQVTVNSKNNGSKYYKVPENRADEFQAEYKKNKKKLNWSTTGIMLATIAAVLTPVAFFSKKIENKTYRTLLGIAAGVVGGIGSMLVTNKIEMNSHAKLLKKYNASTIDYSSSKLPIN